MVDLHQGPAVLGEDVLPRPRNRQVQDRAARTGGRASIPVRVQERAVARQRQRAAVRTHGRQSLAFARRIELNVSEVQAIQLDGLGKGDVARHLAREIRDAALARHTVAFPEANRSPRIQVVDPVRPVVAVRRSPAGQAETEQADARQARPHPILHLFFHAFHTFLVG